MDNYYHTCPPKMSDGRHITDYKESTLADEQIKYVNGIIRDDEYRLFLQNNASQIMEKEWDYLRTNNSCWLNECVHTYPTNMYPGWFYEENSKYNSLTAPNRTTQFMCSKPIDYRCIYNGPKKKISKSPQEKQQPSEVKKTIQQISTPITQPITK